MPNGRSSCDVWNFSIGRTVRVVHTTLHYMALARGRQLIEQQVTFCTSSLSTNKLRNKRALVDTLYHNVNYHSDRI